MTLIRNLALALCLVLLCSKYSNSQTIDYTTGNLINYSSVATDTTSTWNNGVYVNQLCFGGGQPGNCGPNPSVRPDGNINFSYGTADLNQVVNINRALAIAGTGVQLSGFNFSFMAKNGNGWDDGRQDYLAAYVKFYNASGGLAANYDYSAQTNQRYNWTGFSFSETFADPSAASNYSNARVGFVGRDNNYWAGNYGPEINNVAFSLKYRVDPCATNPAYSPTCAGFKNVSTSNNLVPNPGGYAVYGDSINQSYAINVALAAAGSAAQIHGFQWGYVANANGPYCALDAWILGCWDQRTPSVSTNVNITNSAGASLYNVSRTYQYSYNTTNYSYLFPSSQVMSTLGNFNFTASTNDQAYVGSMWSRALYTADPCAVDPLSSATCPGYAVAYAKNLLLGSTVANASAPTAATYATGITTTSNGAPAPAPPPNGAPDPTAAPAPAGSPPPVAGVNTFGSQQPAQGQPQDPSQPAPPAAQQPSTQQASAPGSVSAPGSIPAPGSPAPQPGAPSNQAGPATGGTSTAKVGPNMSLIMSTIGNIQAADKATQAAAVQNAQQVVATSSAAAQAQAFQVVEQLNTMSAASSQTSQQQTTSTSSLLQSQQSTGSVVSLQGPTVLSAQTLSAMAAQSSQTATQSQTSVGSYQSSSSASAYSLTSNSTGKTSFGLSFNSQPVNIMAMVAPQTTQQTMQQRSESRIAEQEVPVPLTLAAMSRGSVISDLINSRPDLGNNQQDQQQNTTVKKNVLPNELAGGVDVASMAQIPKGYEAYSIVTLRDAPFYKPEAIYKDNRTVDNARLLRGLAGGSDAKHQEMVNSQYKIGN